VGLACVSTAQAAAPKGPTPSNNPGTWIGANYPKDALAAGAEGAVAFDVTVGADGVPTGCTVTTGSGSAALDEPPAAWFPAGAVQSRDRRREQGGSGSLPHMIVGSARTDQPVLIVPRWPWMWSRDCRVLADGDPGRAQVIASATCNWIHPGGISRRFGMDGSPADTI
jgi:hypothetical protein